MSSGNYNIEVKRLLKEKNKNKHWIMRGNNSEWATCFIVTLSMLSLMGLFYLIEYIKN